MIFGYFGRFRWFELFGCWVVYVCDGEGKRLGCLDVNVFVGR